MRHALASFVLATAALAACGGTGSVPLTVEVNDGVTAGKLDELQLVVKTLPDTQVTFEDQTKDTGDKATETFVVSKGKLKLGPNNFTITAQQASLLSKKSATQTVTWVAGPKNLFRFYAPANGDFEGEIACGGIMCGTTTLKVTKNGHLPLELESAATGLASVDGVKTNVSPAKRGAVDIDLTKKLGAMPVGKEDVHLPIVLEGDGATTDMLDVSGPVMNAIAARVLAGVEKGPVAFAGDLGKPGDKVDLVVAVGVPSTKLVIAGTPGKYADIDLVAVASPVERFFGCSKSEGGPGIQYNDLEMKVYDRRSGKVVATHKLLADRVPCPPTPTATVKGDVREDDVKKFLASFRK